MKKLYHLQQKTPKVDSFLIADLISRLGITLLVGEPEGCKSMFIRQLALSLSAGSNSFVGRKIRSNNNRVLLVDSEDPEMEITKMLSKQKKSLGVSEISDLIIYKQQNNYNPLRELREIILTEKPSTVIYDTLSDIDAEFLSTDEQLLRKILYELNVISVDNNLNFILTHVTGKGKYSGKAKRSDVLGTQAIIQKVNTIIDIRRSRDNLYSLTILKNKFSSHDNSNRTIQLRLNENEMIFKAI